MALDPSDPVSYAAMSQALTLSGRAADGLAYLEAAMRVDPTWTGWRRYLAGLAYFGTGRFADAAESLEKIDPSSSETWTKINGLEILIAAYGHLGSKNKIATARERLQPLLNRINSDRLTGLMAQAHFPFRNWNDTQRLLDGLSKAGVPELPFGLDGKSKDRLSGTEIAKITFGHETISHEIPSGRPSSSKTELDGTFTAKIGDWESGKGKAWVEGDSMCFSFPKEGRTCAVIFRNPKGTRERANEYLFFQPWNRFEFSVL
jgi:tetratricopeptide (TPR) repeat protein